MRIFVVAVLEPSTREHGSVVSSTAGMKEHGVRLHATEQVGGKLQGGG